MTPPAAGEGGIDWQAQLLQSPRKGIVEAAEDYGVIWGRKMEGRKGIPEGEELSMEQKLQNGTRKAMAAGPKGVRSHTP